MPHVCRANQRPCTRAPQGASELHAALALISIVAAATKQASPLTPRHPMPAVDGPQPPEDNSQSPPPLPPAPPGPNDCILGVATVDESLSVAKLAMKRRTSMAQIMLDNKLTHNTSMTLNTPLNITCLPGQWSEVFGKWNNMPEAPQVCASSSRPISTAAAPRLGAQRSLSLLARPEATRQCDPTTPNPVAQVLSCPLGSYIVELSITPSGKCLPTDPVTLGTTLVGNLGATCSDNTTLVLDVLRGFDPGAWAAMGGLLLWRAGANARGALEVCLARAPRCLPHAHLGCLSPGLLPILGCSGRVTSMHVSNHALAGHATGTVTHMPGAWLQAAAAHVPQTRC